MIIYKKPLPKKSTGFFSFMALVLLCFIAVQNAFATFDYSAQYQKAMSEILSLKLENGRAILNQAKTTEPNNHLLLLAEDYIDFFTILINENQAEYEKLVKNKSARISQIEKGDKKSPWYNYCKAEIYIHWATNRIRFGDYLKAATEIREAYKLLEENIGNHPDFLPNKKTMGMLETLVGTVPEGYQWVVNIVGMDGDINKGMDKIKLVINSKSTLNYVPQLKQEALFIYVYLQMFIVKKPQEAWDLVEKHTSDYKTNLLSCYLRANIALKSKRTNEAITVLQNRPRGKEYHKFYYLDYLLGTAKLFRGDDDAHTYFKIYVSFHTGTNFIKSAYMRLSWFYFLEGNEEKYNIYRSMVKTLGTAEVEEDKRSLKMVESGEKPDKTLLVTMLAFDGGYYTKAINTLNSKKASDYTSDELRLEYNYRKARVLHEQGNTDAAVDLYKLVMEEGKDQPYYFAANSSLMLGDIYEDLKLNSTACSYYKRCSKFPNKEYRNSIQQKAKAGMKRVGCN